MNSTPSSTSELKIFESPVNVGNNYGSRIRGYICIPATGDYTFWIASDDHSELWLSSDENAANKIKIASVSTWTRSREWSKYASQQSAAISLQAGQKYYIEALHKEGYGGDNLAVGWQLPNGTLERPIPGNRLLLFGSYAETTNFQAVNLTASQADESNAEINIFPNPIQRGTHDLSISGYNEINEITVEIVSMTGEVIHSEKIFCEAICNAYLMHIDKELTRGIYLVNVITNGKRFSKKLLVK